MNNLVVAVAKEGCIDETLSFIGAFAKVELMDEVLNHNLYMRKYSGVDSKSLRWMQNELNTIAKDESNHSKLAWRTLD